MKKTKAIIPAMLTVFSLLFMPVNSTMAATNSSVSKVTLPGNQPVAAMHGHLKAHKNPQDVVSVTMVLKLHNQSQIDSYIADLYNPDSPNYKKFLTTQQFTAQFGPRAADVQQVKDFATANGLHVTSIATGNQSVTLSGTVAQLESAFGVQINNYVNARGQSYFANATSPSVPADLAGVISGVVGLDNEPQQIEHALRNSSIKVDGKSNASSPHVSGPVGGYAPSDLRSAYDITPVLNSGIDGTGQRIALVEFDGYVQSNVSTYDHQYGLTSTAPTNVLVDGYSGQVNSTDGEGEVELDIEVLNAIAPKAQVVVYEAPNSAQGLLDLYQRIANNNSEKTVSISWGMCEVGLLQYPSYMEEMHVILAQMALQGQSVFAASGDSGAYDCGDGTTLSVDVPADDPYVTGVGGTNLSMSNGAYGMETAWSESLYGYGGGGGYSQFYMQPAWQTGPGIGNYNYRQVPDVSADADPWSGYSIYTAGGWTIIGGTSAATPLWAGIAALNDQYAANQGKASLGQANSTLYHLFNTTQTYPAYHDVTSGDNLYYQATQNYDLATGIGTPDAYNLIRDINGGNLNTLTITAANNTLTTGTTEPVKVTSMVNGRPTDVTARVTWSSSNATIASVRSGVLYATSPGTATLTATYNNATGTFAITVTPRLVRLNLASSKVQMQTGDMQQLVATATYSDGSTANVTSSVKWSSSNTSLLMVDANGLMSAIKKGTVTVTGRYSNLSVTATVTITPVLTGITVTPSPATVTIGGTPLTLKVTALYNDKSTADVSKQASIYSFLGLVTIRNGSIYGVTKGQDWLYISYNGQYAFVSLNVVPPLKTLQVNPIKQQLSVGNSQALSVTATYTDGSSADVTYATTWSSSNNTIATVDSHGLVTAHKRGTVVITGRYMGRTISSTITVVPVLTQISAKLSSSTIKVGYSASVTVTAYYNDGMSSVVSTQSQITSANGYVTIRGTMVTGKTVGQDTLTITYGGQSTQVPITVITR